MQDIDALYALSERQNEQNMALQLPLGPQNPEATLVMVVRK